MTGTGLAGVAPWACAIHGKGRYMTDASLIIAYCQLPPSAYLAFKRKAMKAYYSTAYGGSESSVYGDLPDPSAGAEQLLIEVKAVSINPVDWKIKQGDARFVTGFRFPRIFGADEVMGYSREELASCTGKFDAIMDAYGKMDLRLVRQLLKRVGTYASTLFIPPPYLSIIFIRLLHGKRLTSANMRRLPEDWKELEKLYAEGRLRSYIENMFPLDHAADAFDLAVKGRPRGKVIVTV